MYAFMYTVMKAYVKATEKKIHLKWIFWALDKRIP